MNDRRQSFFLRLMIVLSGLIVLDGVARIANAQTNIVTTAFTSNRTTSIWPIPSGTRDAIIETFGPSIQTSTKS